MSLDAGGAVCSDGAMKRLVVASALGCMGFGVAVGCPGEEGGERPSIVLEDFHPPDVAEARATWRDGGSGLVFVITGSGWERLEGDALGALGEDVKLAVRQGARCLGWVLARPAAGLGARDAADAARRSLAWEALEVQVDEDVKYDIWTARRYEVVGRVDGRTVAERATYWLEDGKLYAVVARASESHYVSRRRCLDLVTAGFSLGYADKAAGASPE